MWYGVIVAMLGVLMSPNEVLVIVIVTAIVVYLAARKRNAKKPK